MIPAGSTEGEPGNHDRVHEGGTSHQRMRRGARRLRITSPDLSRTARRTEPRVLKSIKKFSARRKTTMCSRPNAEVQARIEKRREGIASIPAIRMEQHKDRAQTTPEGQTRERQTRARKEARRAQSGKGRREGGSEGRGESTTPKEAHGRPPLTAKARRSGAGP